MKSKKAKKVQVLAPIYIQLRELIRNSIEDGDYLPGTAIPSENELAQVYGINRITVRNAVDALVQEGLLKRIQGKGVFVVGTKLEKTLGEHEGFLQTHPDVKNSPSIKTKSLILRTANEKYADLFDIDKSDEIYHLRRMVHSNNEKVAYEEIFIPKKVLPEFSDIDSSVFSLEEILAFYEVKIEGKRQSIEIIQGDEYIRKLVSAPENSALFLMETWYQNFRGQNIMFIQQWVRSDQAAYTIKL